MTLLGNRQPSSDVTYAKIGYVASLLAAIRARPHMPMALAIQMAGIAIGLDQVKFYFSTDGRPVAYVSWALLAPDVEARVLQSNALYLHPSEWNEGGSLWIVDFVAPFGDVAQILRDLRDNTFRDYPTACYVRHKGTKVLIQEISRQSIASFFVRGTTPALSGPVVLPGWNFVA